MVAFKQPSPDELRHDFLWRHVRALPERGQIAIFNRSHYEEVLVVRVHPEPLPAGADGGSEGVWRRRFQDLNAWERHLRRSGTRIVKVFLHLLREEQRRRRLARRDDRAKPWKFCPADRKYQQRAPVGRLMVAAIDHPDLSQPAPAPELVAELEAARSELRAG